DRFAQTEHQRDGERVGVSKDSHGQDKVLLHFLVLGAKSPDAGHELCGCVGNDGLDDEDEGNDGQIGEGVGFELAGELGEDQAR
nr:hypothetical protein [Tanacetum cinerariifolium]